MRPLNYDDIDFLKKLQTDMNTSGHSTPRLWSVTDAEHITGVGPDDADGCELYDSETGDKLCSIDSLSAFANTLGNFENETNLNDVNFVYFNPDCTDAKFEYDESADTLTYKEFNNSNILTDRTFNDLSDLIYYLTTVLQAQITVIWYEIYNKPTDNVFLTEAAAKQHLKDNDNHLFDPHIYHYYPNRNPELCRLLDIIANADFNNIKLG